MKNNAFKLQLFQMVIVKRELKKMEKKWIIYTFRGKFIFRGEVRSNPISNPKSNPMNPSLLPSYIHSLLLLARYTMRGLHPLLASL